MTTEGIEFINAEPQQVLDYLNNRRVEQREVSPSRLVITNGGRYLRLRDTAGGKEYPVRRAFLYKLLRWHSFPVRLLPSLSVDTIINLCNDFLLQLKGDPVILKLENEEALSITSTSYSEITDLEIIHSLEKINLRSISRNDFMIRISGCETHRIVPRRGDVFGVGVDIINSETGFRALTVSHYLLRYTCSNGASIRISENNRRIHYAQKEGALQEFLLQQIKKTEEDRKLLGESLKRMLGKKVNDEKDKVHRIQHVLGRDKIGLNNDSLLYDYFNKVTDLAKKFDLSKRMYLEELAGDLLMNNGLINQKVL